MRTAQLLLAALLILTGSAMAQNREEKVRNDKQKVEAAGYWIYNDLPLANQRARESRKPIIVVLRCIPCEECVKLDDELIDADERVRPLLEQFVRVRVVATNGLDLSLFQFDTDQSFTIFFVNAEGTIYGRFGTRSHRTNWVGDVSVDGLAQAMKRVLALHADSPNNAKALAAKRGPVPEFARPELFPSLKSKYTSQLDYPGKVVPSCIHCHQIGDAARELSFSRKATLTEAALFPYPHPKAIGLTLDPKQVATVLNVEPDSAAAKAGFQVGDQLQTFAGQPLIAMADIQWVLHHTAASGASIAVELLRANKPITVTLALASGWRQKDDISWRASTWGLRRKALGGMFVVVPTDDDRQKAKLASNAQGLLVQHVGQFAPHDLAHKAGVRKGDILQSFDGRTDFRRETDLLVYSLMKKHPGDTVTLELLRNGQKQTATLKLP